MSQPGMSSAGPPGGRIVYDGKRMRKAITRRTIDHCASIMRLVESLHVGASRFRTCNLYAALQPTPSHIINVLLGTLHGIHGFDFS